jgi:hypothetical protein
MSQDRTHGYDAVVEFNERVANDLLPDEVFPPVRFPPVDTNVGDLRLTGEPEVFFLRDPSVDVLAFDSSVPDGVSISMPFSAGNMTATGRDGVPRDAAINGTVRIVHAVGAYNDDVGRRCLGMDFSTLPANRVRVDISEMTLPGPEGLMETILGTMLHNYLKDTVQRLEIYAVDVPDNDEPYLPDDFDVRVINDDCAALLISTTPETVGDRSAFSESDIPHGADTTVMISSCTLLLYIACPEILAHLHLDGEPDDYFNYSTGVLQLRDPVSISHLIDHALVDSVMLNSMRITAGMGRVDCEAGMRVEGFGYEASARVTGYLQFDVTDDGALRLEYHAGVADVDLYVYPWVWILMALGIALLPAIGGLVALVLPVLPAIIDPIAELIARHIGTGGVESISLGLPIEIDSVVLDDLQFSGRTLTPARRHSPAPRLWLIGGAEETSAAIGGMHERTIIPGVTETRAVISKAHHATYRAESEHMLFPIRYDWSLDDRAISGEGIVTIRDASVRYLVDGRKCELFLDTGESLRAVLRVLGTAANGVSIIDTVSIALEGTTEIRSFHGVELLEGPSVLQVLGVFSADPEFLETPFPEEAIMPSRSSVISQQRAALKVGMGVELPPGTFS